MSEVTEEMVSVESVIKAMMREYADEIEENNLNMDLQSHRQMDVEKELKKEIERLKCMCQSYETHLDDCDQEIKDLNRDGLKLHEEIKRWKSKYFQQVSRSRVKKKR